MKLPQADEPMTSRELWTLAVETLGQLLDDDLVLARAVRTRDYRRLYAVATIARLGLDESMAMTDPYLYQRLSQAIVLMNLKGYGGLDIDKLRTLIEQGHIGRVGSLSRPHTSESAIAKPQVLPHSPG